MAEDTLLRQDFGRQGGRRAEAESRGKGEAEKRGKHGA